MTNDAIPNAVPKQQEPVWPKVEMPESPNVAHNKTDGYLPNCEGQVELPLDVSASPVPAPAPGKIRILIGVPILAITYEFFESFLRFWTELVTSKDQRYELGYAFAYRKPVHMAEESLVNIAQYNKCTHILFMDDDIYDVTKSDLDKLVDADKDFISGVMHASKFPHAMCVFRRYNPERKVIDMPVDNSMYRLYEVPCTCPKCKTGLSHWDIRHCPACGEPQNQLIQQADLTPFPFTLIKLSIFDKLKKPWFHCTTKYPSDSWFADRLIEAGMTEYAHMGVRLNHAGITDETKPHFMNMGMIKAKKSKGIVELTPEQMDMHQHLLITKMKETEEKQKQKPAFTSDGKIVANRMEEKEELYTLVTHGNGRDK